MRTLFWEQLHIGISQELWLLDYANVLFWDRKHPQTIGIGYLITIIGPLSSPNANHWV